MYVCIQVQYPMKMLVRIAYREDPDQKRSGLSLFSLSWLFWQTSSVGNLEHDFNAGQ